MRVPARPGAALAASWLLLGLLLAMVADPALFTRYSATAGAAVEHLRAPGGAHWFGTDQLGRDVFARIVYGAHHTLPAALLAVATGLVCGTFIGALAGAAGGRIDAALTGLMDVLMAIPELLMSLTIVILLGFGTFHAAIAVGVGQIAGFARIVRADVTRVGAMTFVEAARGSGATFAGLLWRHILPNCAASILGLSVLRYSTAILSIATLGFLGYGAPPPAPEWGLMIAEGRDYLTTAWWMTTFPGLAVLLVALAVNRISRTLADPSGPRP
ncbi:binding-protein-dependent transport systems inner membrane component [Gluconacetobacter diazotrophicus PA1 5]|uniref:Putative dipeptide transport system permease protein n=1 Tax=Gluconacetobacter diazotrophicus (strain ATCC 49037 / DSM 5601 / CCUG 37298 / CIP 103539 / LMG 7603 / PAl5) TaxID=272568 RepID=A9H2R8_GLUDA|nr:ABC transporter permease [Gluconacetobacter diazotrophicus]ACI52068.1 binding-protein-dependent transport systems inner membrane component [Gluconacetobacter diazotrophicus PA1 5]TWB03060.1 peptide/nickel transport system permease protein [Gluconacetobacter diazotrophicus]CAP54192.1 putative dipeptide transport system permease protein [Gluconacetobacter diazotrophicus PA1 5]